MASDFVPVASGEPDVALPRAGGLVVEDRGVVGERPCALYVWQGDYPWDVRVEKVAQALTDGGYDTRILARNCRRAPTTEPLPEGTVERMPPWSWTWRSLDAALQFPAFANPRWMRHIARAVRRASSPVIVVRDLPLAPTAVWSARRLRVPVILDMAENYPALLRDNWAVGRQGRWDVLIRNPGAARLVEAYSLRHVDHVMVVVEESADRVAALGVPRERITVVSNTPPRERAASTRALRSLGAMGRLEVVYLGILEIPRGLDEAIDAVRILRERSVAVRLTIVGTGRDAPLFQTRARGAGLTAEDVRFTGYVSREEAMHAVATADVGLLANHRTEQWQTSIPNKLFDYMAAGLAVVTSDTAPCARIVRDTAAGEIFRAGDAADLARAVERLTDSNVRAAAGEAGRRAVLSRYNWERDSAVLLNVVDSLARRASESSRRRGRA